MLVDEAAVVAQAVSIARDGQVRTSDGSLVTVAARSLCVHGDTPGSVALAQAVRAALTAQGFAVEAFLT